MNTNLSNSRLQELLVAAAAFMGYDNAIAILQAQRKPVHELLGRVHDKLSVGGIIDERSAVRHLQRAKRPYHPKVPDLKSGISTILSGGISTILSDGATSIGDILTQLFRMSLVSNTGPENSKAVMNILKSDPRFARGKNGNTYKLRSNAKCAA
jgi:hypothetical protein